jgi:hypothetical protein
VTSELKERDDEREEKRAVKLYLDGITSSKKLLRE